MTAARVVTFGCRLNRHESEVIDRHAAASGLRDTVIVNTCAVTASAVREARRTVRRVRRETPGARIVVTGCAAQTDPDSFAVMAEVDAVVGNEEKLRAATWTADPPAGSRVTATADIRAVAGSVGTLTGRTRSFVPVQNGCDHRCTFCIIPYGRGPSRSVPPEAVVAEVREAVRRGVPEVVLTGVDLTDYGAGLANPVTFGRLVRRILRDVPELPRLRLSSIDAAELDDALIGCFAEEARLMPHLHLSLQSHDPMILKRMRRRHTPEQAERLLERVLAARPETAFGADFIAGFPTETDAMFENTLAAVERLGLVHLHVFPYSPRPGTPAARMPQVAPETRQARGKALRAAGERMFRRRLRDRTGTMAAILVEGEGGLGWTEDYLPAAVPGAAPGSIVERRVEAVGRRLCAA
ncbi:MAG: tRNA (N(6)-L-threonylcarbamoyladenosine(37)-C(2))-methylthiotransferase MtaB [Rhodospirillales bacterium]|nr:tRNA (N(6)-L-threonylcarbamoyladenosine(37)-C(2))-methylthiotransferase MtaB [Rhodospirillales bacterium]